MWGQRLYLRIWLAVVAAVGLLALLAAVLWQMQAEHEREQRPGRLIVIRNAEGQVIAQAPARPMHGPAPEFEVTLSDGQTVSIQLPRPMRPPGRSEPFWLQTPFGFVGLLLLVAMAVALGAYPIVRRLTQRLEALQSGVQRWGEGDLSTRLPVQGTDEVAFLAQRFNTAAERVQALLGAHKALLANASHELRSPLTRIRMGLGLLDAAQDPAQAREQKREIERSLAELDELIDEILLASRLDLKDGDGLTALGPLEEVDLGGLAAEECARIGATLDWQDLPHTPCVQGHPKLLRRLVRNLLENARRYGLKDGDPASVTVSLRLTPGGVELAVADQGLGVPPELRERIFEPFYRLPGASERDGGVGLGLALVRGIAQRHGGRVRCESSSGGGARFVVELPLRPIAPV